MTTDRKAMWQVLQVYREGGKLLTAVKILYKESKACMRVGREEREYLPVNIGLRQ